MKNLDMRFKESLIHSWIGREFTEYKCDTFDFTNSVTQIVGLLINEQYYSLTNIQEPVDYYGNQDDIAIFKIKKTEAGKIQSAFEDIQPIITLVNSTIEKIDLLNENQQIYDARELKYNVWLTRGIIFYVDGRKISFEKDMVPFSEEIIIRKGYYLLDKIADKNFFLEGWDDGLIPKCTRVIKEITA